MATKSLTVLVDADRYAELKEYAAGKTIKDGEDRVAVTVEQAASMVLSSGLSRLTASTAYSRKMAAAKRKEGKPARVARAAAPKAKAAGKGKAAVKAASKPAPKAKAKGRIEAKAKPKVAAKASATTKKGPVKLERKRSVPRGLAPQRPSAPAGNGSAQTPAPEPEVAQA